MTSSPAIPGFETPAGDAPRIARGGAEFWRVRFAMFFGSFATFALHRERAETAKAQASALYLFFYYTASSVAGTIGGWAFAFGRRPGVAAFVGAMSTLALLIAIWLSRAPPPAHLRPT